MPHPYQAYLKEYQYAIDHLAPTVPDDIKIDAQKRHDELLSDENVSEKEIRQALAKTGKGEYPHRHAYQELAGKREEDMRNKLVFEHVEENVREKLQKHLDSGVSLDDIVGSELFETEFAPDERHQVEDGILDAKDHVREEIEKENIEETEEYKKLVEKYTAELKVLEETIQELEGLKSRDKEGKWGEEIDGRVARFREGFSVTEHDPDLNEIKKEIEYWIGTFGEEL